MIDAMRPRTSRAAWMGGLAALAVLAGGSARAGSGTGYHPYAKDHRRVPTVVMSAEANQARRDAMAADRTPVARSWAVLEQVESADSALQLHTNPPSQRAASDTAGTPDGWQQRGGVVLPSAVVAGELQVDPDVAFAIEDLPGNAYPRKHTLYLNFVGADMLAGADNSALNKSTLAKAGPYPAYQGGDQKALSIAQAVAEDVAAYGVQVKYLPAERPSQTVPYTMEMVGGNWTDTNIESAAGGVAPGADCGALGQRHVVYTFAAPGLGANSAANIASQEAGHAWGLDHTTNCGSVMSYCGIANGGFSNTCDPLCEEGCQGPNSAGCRLTHEEFCGEDNDQQNEDAELTFLFGGPEPDVEPPFVNILSPEDGAQFDVGADVDLRAEVDDNYGGFGWKYIITHNGEVLLDEVAFDRWVDDDLHAALNLTSLEAGVWTITVEVEDHYEQVTSQTVTFDVGDGSVGAVDTGTDSAADSDSGDGMGSEGTAAAQDDGDDDDGGGGCNCRVRTSPGAPLAPVGLLLGVVVWRRRWLRRHV